MARTVRFASSAERDFSNLFWWIHSQSGRRAALRYTTRLRQHCQRFDASPFRGTRRDDIRLGLRIVGFEKRVSIAFTVDEAEILIIRVLYGGRDVEGRLAGANDP